MYQSRLLIYQLMNRRPASNLTDKINGQLGCLGQIIKYTVRFKITVLNVPFSRESYQFRIWSHILLSSAALFLSLKVATSCVLAAVCR